MTTNRRFSIFAALSLCFAASAAAFERARLAIERFVFTALSVLARPAIYHPRPTALLLRGPALAYDGPPIHSLRHEAGTPQRAARRHI